MSKDSNSDSDFFIPKPSVANAFRPTIIFRNRTSDFHPETSESDHSYFKAHQKHPKTVHLHKVMRNSKIQSQQSLEKEKTIFKADGLKENTSLKYTFEKFAKDFWRAIRFKRPEIKRIRTPSPPELDDDSDSECSDELEKKLLVLCTNCAHYAPMLNAVVNPLSYRYKFCGICHRSMREDRQKKPNVNVTKPATTVQDIQRLDQCIENVEDFTSILSDQVNIFHEMIRLDNEEKRLRHNFQRKDKK